MGPHAGVGGVLERAVGTRRAHRLRSQLAGQLHLLPDFIIVGAARGGTSGLLARLNGHPNVLPGPQDTHYFDTRRHTYGLPWYRSQFPGNQARRRLYAKGLHPILTGEADSSYLAHPHVPGRIARALPGVRLIVLLRDPADRAVSQWAWGRQQGVETRTFRETVQAELGQPGDEGGLRIPRHRHLDDPLIVRLGLYKPQLERWLTHFPRERLLVVESERLIRDPSAVAAVLDFLGLPRLELPGSPVSATDGAPGPGPDDAPEADVLARLRAFYRPWNRALAESLDMSFAWDDAAPAERPEAPAERLPEAPAERPPETSA